MRLPKFRCKNKAGNWCFFTVLHNGNVNEENFVLETLSEFTGLLVKQGVEIYEGDIVATKNSKYKVVFDKCCFWGIDEMGKYPIYQISHYIMDDERFEVIGNIYENPELLETK